MRERAEAVVLQLEDRVVVIERFVQDAQRHRREAKRCAHGFRSRSFRGFLTIRRLGLLVLRCFRRCCRCCFRRVRGQKLGFDLQQVGAAPALGQRARISPRLALVIEVRGFVRQVLVVRGDDFVSDLFHLRLFERMEQNGHCQLGQQTERLGR